MLNELRAWKEPWLEQPAGWYTHQKDDSEAAQGLMDIAGVSSGDESSRGPEFRGYLDRTSSDLAERWVESTAHAVFFT